jgi:chitinase
VIFVAACVERRLAPLLALLAVMSAHTQIARAGERETIESAWHAKVVAYVTSWSTQPVAIDTRLITHVNLAFALIDDTGRVTIPSDVAETRLRQVVAVRRAHPALRVLVSVGGWAAEGFSDAALTDRSRQEFAESAVDLLRRFDLDGIDLDWEYPGQDVAGIKARPEDRRNFTELLAAVRAQLDAEGRRSHRAPGDPYLLTIATADREYFDHVDMPRLHRYVDWINVMAYDFYNSLTRTTGHHAGLHRATSAPTTDRWGSASIEQHVAAGVPARKLVLGVAFYGRRFEGVTPSLDGLNQPYEKYGGDHSYRELVESYIDRDGYVRHWDQRALAPWLWNAATRTFVTYDDPESIRRKAEFARQLGGVMFWELSQDTPDGALLQSIAAGLGLGDKMSADATIQESVQQ